MASTGDNPVHGSKPPGNYSPAVITMNDKPIVVQSEHLSGEATSWLEQHSRLVAMPFDAPGFSKSLTDAEGLVIRTYTTVDEALLDRARHLRVVGRAGTGLDNIDLDACRSRNIQVVYTPEANTQAVVEYVFQMVFDALRPRVTLSGAVNSQEWQRLRAETVAKRQMSDLSLGILGMGRVGQSVARVAAALGVEVQYNDLVEIPHDHRFGAEPVPVEALFEHTDILTIHIDGRASNRGFVKSWFIDRMKSDVLLVNTSRGFVVDNVSLAQFLASHPAAEAHLDVHEPEPFDETYPLLRVPNAKLYPHLASRTETAMREMSWVVRDVMAVLEGGNPRWPAI